MVLPIIVFCSLPAGPKSYLTGGVRWDTPVILPLGQRQEDWDDMASQGNITRFSVSVKQNKKKNKELFQTSKLSLHFLLPGSRL